MASLAGGANTTWPSCRPIATAWWRIAAAALPLDMTSKTASGCTNEISAYRSISARAVATAGSSSVTANTRLPSRRRSVAARSGGASLR
ncbi:Uncharacterised protein [Bordetella pertussis]|nr:Uncharacterised protein [Bordetella pertussis]